MILTNNLFMLLFNIQRKLSQIDKYFLSLPLSNIERLKIERLNTRSFLNPKTSPNFAWIAREANKVHKIRENISSAGGIGIKRVWLYQLSLFNTL